jgi:exopolyphosphatase/guanosine-5'-triphosphate,3'-diphosphate pyrophosphatase
VFGSHFAPADDELSRWPVEREGTTSELYVLSVHGDASVKVRDELMDVKRRLARDDRGAELWAPTLKAPFPLASEDVAAVLVALGLDGDAPSEDCSLDALVELLESDDDVITVAVSKLRRHHRVDGCIVESTEIAIDDQSTRTIVVESTDVDEVIRTVHALGLDALPNTSLSRGLKALVGFGPTRYAVIDVGTNSVKFHLGERHADGTLSTIVDRAEMTRLGEGQTDDGQLAEGALERTVAAVVAMVVDARERGAAEVVAVGTAGLRRAPNQRALVDAVRSRAGLGVEVISGPEEARLAYLAASSALPATHGRLAVFDSGGGSTQFTFGQAGRVDEQFSLDVGAVRIAEEFGLAEEVSSEQLDAVFAALRERLGRLDDRDHPAAVIAIGGTATNVAAVRHGLAEYDPDVVHGTVIDVLELDRQIELYRVRDAAARRSIPGLQPARAEVILGGACIVRTALAKLGHGSMTVSDRGLRHGVVIDRFAG